jgi:hypothetical protein
LVWQETALGSTYLSAGCSSPPIPDVLSIARSYPGAGRHEIRVFEVKVSRSDFRADVRAQKYRRYFGYCHRLWFATPAGLLRLDDIPADAGWIELDPRGPVWRTRKSAPKAGRPDWTATDWFALILSGDLALRQHRRLRDRLIEFDNRLHRHRNANGYQALLGTLRRIAAWTDNKAATPYETPTAVHRLWKARQTLEVEAWWLLEEVRRLRKQAGLCAACGQPPDFREFYRQTGQGENGGGHYCSSHTPTIDRLQAVRRW